MVLLPPQVPDPLQVGPVCPAPEQVMVPQGVPEGFAEPVLGQVVEDPVQTAAFAQLVAVPQTVPADFGVCVGQLAE